MVDGDVGFLKRKKDAHSAAFLWSLTHGDSCVNSLQWLSDVSQPLLRERLLPYEEHSNLNWTFERNRQTKLRDTPYAGCGSLPLSNESVCRLFVCLCHRDHHQHTSCSIKQRQWIQRSFLPVHQDPEEYYFTHSQISDMMLQMDRPICKASISHFPGFFLTSLIVCDACVGEKTKKTNKGSKQANRAGLMAYRVDTGVCLWSIRAGGPTRWCHLESLWSFLMMDVTSLYDRYIWGCISRI